MFRDFLLLCIFGILACSLDSTVARLAIIGGKKAGVDQFPYQVSLLFREHGYDCGGVVIGESHILTAAHCVVQDGHIINMPVSIHAGTNDLDRLDKPAVIVAVKKIYVPKYYKRAVGAVGDIAVLLLKHPLHLSKHIKKLNLPKHQHEDYSGKSGIIAGFGWDWIKKVGDKVHGGHSDPELRYGQVDILNYCQQGQKKMAIPEKLLCAKMKQNQMGKLHGVCHGDSGGPLVYEDAVIGILSFGPKDCIENESSALYTRVSDYLEFIEHAIHNKHHDDIITHELQ